LWHAQRLDSLTESTAAGECLNTGRKGRPRRSRIKRKTRGISSETAALGVRGAGLVQFSCILLAIGDVRLDNNLKSRETRSSCEKSESIIAWLLEGRLATYCSHACVDQASLTKSR
jgi:hypothetical protein